MRKEIIHHSQIIDLMFSWKFREAYEILDSWGENEKLTGLILKARLLSHQGKFNVALNSINQTIQLAEDSGEKISEFNAIAVKSNILLKLGKPHALTELFQMGNKLINNFDTDTLDQTIWAQSYFYNYYGIYLMLNGDMDQALINLTRSIGLKTTIKDFRGLASTHQNLGHYYITLGEYENATDHINQSMDLNEQLNYPYGIALGLSNMGNILRLKGKVIKSKDYLQKALEVFLKVDGNPNPHVIAHCYSRIGRLHRLLNDDEMALSNFQKAFEAVEQGSHPVTFVEIIFDLILLTIDNVDQSETDIWIEKLEELHRNNEDNKLISLHVKFVQALKLRKSSNRLKDIVKTESIFLSIIEGEVISNEINMLAMIYYLEILFIEYRVLQDESNLENIEKYTSEILKIANSQNSIILVIEVHILKSKIAFLKLNIEDAVIQLNTALSFATDNKLSFLTNKIENEKKLIQDFVARKLKMADMESSITNRIDEIDILNYLNDVSKVVRS